MQENREEMRKTFIFYFIIIFSAVVLSNCSKAPVYPETPEIEFESMQRYSSGDSVVLTIKFKDGDGDLGLSDDETTSPYQEYDYVKNGSGQYVEIGDSPSNPAYNCFDYLIGDYNPDVDTDTILIERNSNYFNYHIDVWVKQSNSTFTKFDFTSFCTDYNSRFPLLNSKKEKGPIEGSLSYTIKDIGALGLTNETVKFNVYIIDRALHQSNILETPEILID
jgi:hypothetical protein